jgi:hypothetical protein
MGVVEGKKLYKMSEGSHSILLESEPIALIGKEGILRGK